jgi:hypothetical protein
LIRIAEEFLLFFDRQLIKDYGVLPLAYTSDELVVGTYKTEVRKIKKVLGELLPFNISIFKIKRGFFDEEYVRLFYKPSEFIVYDKEKLILSPGKMVIEEKMSDMEIVRYIIVLMIKKKKRFIILSRGENKVGNEKIYDFVYDKIKKFFIDNFMFNPIPIKVEGRKLYLYYELSDDDKFYLELFPESLWEKDIFKMTGYYEPDKLNIVLGEDSIRKRLFLELFLKNFDNNIFLTTPPKPLKIGKIDGFVFKPELLDKILDLIKSKKRNMHLINGDISLYTIFMRKRVKNTIISLPTEDDKGLTKKIKTEKVESAIKEAYDLNVIKVEFTEKSTGKFVGYKPIIKKYKKIL